VWSEIGAVFIDSRFELSDFASPLRESSADHEVYRKKRKEKSIRGFFDLLLNDCWKSVHRFARFGYSRSKITLDADELPQGIYSSPVFLLKNNSCQKNP